MSQRDSGYERKERDLYETPEWVTLALVPHLRRAINSVWEPAAASWSGLRLFHSRNCGCREAANPRNRSLR